MLPSSRHPDGISISPSLKEPSTLFSSVSGTPRKPTQSLESKKSKSATQNEPCSTSPVAYLSDNNAADSILDKVDVYSLPDLDLKWLEKVVKKLSILTQHDGSMTTTFRNVRRALSMEGVELPIADLVSIAPDCEDLESRSRYLKSELELIEEEQESDGEDDLTQSESDEESSVCTETSEDSSFSGEFSETDVDSSDEEEEDVQNEKDLYANEIGLESFCERAKTLPLPSTTLGLPSSQPTWLSLVSQQYTRIADELRTASDLTNPALLLLAMGAYVRSKVLFTKNESQHEVNQGSRKCDQVSSPAGTKTSRKRGPRDDVLLVTPKRLAYQTP